MGQEANRQAAIEAGGDRTRRVAIGRAIIDDCDADEVVALRDNALDAVAEVLGAGIVRHDDVDQTGHVIVGAGWLRSEELAQPRRVARGVNVRLAQEIEGS